MDTVLYILLADGLRLSEEVREKSEKLRRIKDKIASIAGVDDYKRSAKVSAGDIWAKIYLPQRVKWHQPSLEKLRRDVGDSVFFKMFIWEYKPIKELPELTNFFDTTVQSAFDSAAIKQKTSPNVDIYTKGLNNYDIK